MFKLRFGESAPERRSVEQLRGIEGVRVRELYKGLANQFGVRWLRRDYNPSKFDQSDIPNQCLSAATSCLYGITEAAVLAAGYAPAIGFLHTGKPLSFVYDIADLFKFETVVPEAFRVAAAFEKGKLDRPPEMATRHACRDAFRRTRLLARIIPLIEEILSAGELPPPKIPADSVGPAFPEPDAIADPGFRS
jgi:CRISPR-associated protein Cas1